MAVTTTTSVTELILAKAVDTLILAYQFDEVVGVPFARFKNIADQPTAAASFPRWVKDAHADIASESTSLTPEELETTAVDVTVARVGIAREVSESALEDTVIGRAQFMASIIRDAAILLGEAADEDLMAQYANATNEVSDTGQPAEILDLVDMMASQRAAKCRGPQVYSLHDIQLKHIQQAQVAATAQPWMAFYQPNADGSNFGGYFMGAPMFASSLNPTANAAVDRVGSLHAQGQSAPEYAAYGYVVKRAPTTKLDEDILADTHQAATIARYGVGTIAANFATKLVTSAS